MGQHILTEYLARPVVFQKPDRLTDVRPWQGHIPFAFWCIDTVRPAIFVELGTHRGDSYCAFCQAVGWSATRTQCYAIDTWRGDRHAGHYGPEVLDELRAYHDPRYGRFSHLVRATFDDAAESFADGSIDLLHIDGLHMYDAVRHDFETWRPKLSARGVVLFHDITVRGRQFGVWKLWEELSRTHPSFAFLHSHGLGVLAVGPDVPPAIGWLTSCTAEEMGTVRQFFSTLGEQVQHSTAPWALARRRLTTFLRRAIAPLRQRTSDR